MAIGKGIQINENAKTKSLRYKNRHPGECHKKLPIRIKHRQRSKWITSNSQTKMYEREIYRQ